MRRTPHQYHLVWGTKYHRRCFKPYLKADSAELMHQLEERYPTVKT